MQLVAGLYKSCGGGKQVRPRSPRFPRQQMDDLSETGLTFIVRPQASRTAATEAYEAQQARYERESAARAERKAAEVRAREAEKERIAKAKADKERMKQQARSGTQTRTRRPPFNFEQVRRTTSSLLAALSLSRSADDSVLLAGEAQDLGLCRAGHAGGAEVRLLPLPPSRARPPGAHAHALVASLLQARQRPAARQPREGVGHDQRARPRVPREGQGRPQGAHPLHPAHRPGRRRRLPRHAHCHQRAGASRTRLTRPPFISIELTVLLVPQIVNAVQMYDRMSKPAELDSDDEAIEEAKRMAKQQGLSVPPSATPHDAGARDDADTQSIRSRLSAFDMQDREVDKLQSRQRRRLERHLSSRGPQGGVHPDLQDLAFGPTGGCVSLPLSPLSPSSSCSSCSC